MINRYLLMWLESPLQSWGFDSKFSRRESLNFPTKSGILGLLCSALGAGGEQRELLERMAPLTNTVLSFVRAHIDSNQNCIKNDRSLMLRDFHMVGSDYDDQNPWENLLIPKTSDGLKPIGSGTKMTYRYYIQNGYFAVIVETPSDIAENYAFALQNPVWDLYLGRKCCVPTDFIYRGMFDTEDEAIEQALCIAKDKLIVEEFRVLDGEHQGEMLILNDVPLQFGEHKKYRDRSITVVST